MATRRTRAWGEIPKKKEENENGVYNEKEIEKYQEYLKTLQQANDERTLLARSDRQSQAQSQPPPQEPQQPAPDQTSPGRNTQLAATLAQSDTSDLVTEVRIPDDPNGVLPPDHPALSILGNSSLVIQRQMEMMNLLMGFEQANRYIIMDGQGQTIGYIAEQDHGFGRAMARQFARTHRSFTTYIFDRNEREVLRIHRPFAWINSRIRIYDPIPEGGYGEMATSTDLQGLSANSVVNPGQQAQVSPLKLEEMRIIGEAQQQWAPLRRKYNLFSYRPLEPARDDGTPRLESGETATTDTKALSVTESATNENAIEAGMAQFAHVNEPFLSWDFTLRDESQNTIGSVNRNFAGFAREIFTDTGVYALRMDSAAQSSALETAGGEEVARYEREATAMTLDQRAVMLATAVSIDFDYFSRHSHAGSGGFMPIFWPMGGGAAGAGEAGAAGAGAAGAAGEAGAIEGASGAVGAAGRAAGAAGAGEGAIAGAGTMAGYEAMQRGAYGSRGGDDASPQANEPFSADGQYPQQGGGPGQQGGQDVWGEGDDPWGRGGPGDGPPPSSGSEGGEGEGGGGWGDFLSDFFDE
ncbi:Phospholipid scramblase family protein [Pseudocercospora fuligena]|uniref:Phospholipid scramblase family protein n=1 Tax=Pseudocercospora fuligena TaxID=685502 RepID=A0A8H6VPH7_9PEZI|nr:Phospholipid scramblase family protein [Pseudocercospora fuligena]